jgi:rhodanese-related sulfurtransferase
VSPLRFVYILALALALAAYSAWLRAERKPQTDLWPSQSVAGIPLLDRAQADALWHDSSTLFVDVRSPIDYQYGHILGAISMPEEEFDKLFPSLRPRLEQARTIVVYCKSVDCGKSLWVAIRLRNLGLMQTQIYPHGWNEWSLHDLPISRTATR